MIILRILFYLAFNATWVMPLRAVYLLSDVVCTIAYWLAPHWRRVMRENMRVVLPEASDQEITKIVYRGFLNLGRNLTEIFRMHKINWEPVYKECNLKPLEVLKEKMGSDKGGIIATAHFCNWELSARFVTHVCGTLHSIALPERFSFADKYYVRARKSVNNVTVPLEGSSRACLRALRDGDVVAVLGDRSYTEEGIELPFFDRTLRFPTGIAQFSIKTGAPILPYFMIRTGTGRFTVLDYAPIEVPEQGTKQERIETIMKIYVGFLEDAVRKYPEFWFAFYELWKEPADGSLNSTD